MLKFTLLSSLIFVSAASAFLLCNTLKNKNIAESFFYNSIFYFVFAMCICCYFVYTGEITSSTISNLQNDQILSYTYCAFAFIATTLMTSYLYKSYSVLEIAPYKNALSPLLQFIIGYLIFSEKATPYKVMGGLLMVTGIYIFSQVEKSS
jgi:drug/metabolite transporter (DMT)-like permease